VTYRKTRAFSRHASPTIVRITPDKLRRFLMDS
jgi:hypothetical protein